MTSSQTNRKTKQERMSTEVIPLKKRTVEALTGGAAPAVPSSDRASLGSKKRTPEQSRTLRLAQNRKAARESRRRKKTLVEDLQRSLVFFSRTNAGLKQQNDDLTRRLLESHGILAKMGEPVPSLKAVKNQVPSIDTPSPAPEAPKQEAVAATCATPIKPRPANLPLPVMQPGATMQAMADFQQAAAVAMQAAEQGIKANTGTFHAEGKSNVAMV
jgi:hypothetical protein